MIEAGVSIDKFPFLKKGDYLSVPAEPCSFSLPYILTSKHKTAATVDESTGKITHYRASVKVAFGVEH